MGGGRRWSPPPSPVRRPGSGSGSPGAAPRSRWSSGRVRLRHGSCCAGGLAPGAAAPAGAAAAALIQQAAVGAESESALIQQAVTRSRWQWQLGLEVGAESGDGRPGRARGGGGSHDGGGGVGGCGTGCGTGGGTAAEAAAARSAATRSRWAPAPRAVGLRVGLGFRLPYHGACQRRRGRRWWRVIVLRAGVPTATGSGNVKRNIVTVTSGPAERHIKASGGRCHALADLIHAPEAKAFSRF